MDLIDMWLIAVMGFSFAATYVGFMKDEKKKAGN